MQEIFANPKVYVVMLILCILLAMHYYTSYFTKRQNLPQGYLGSTAHEHTMLDTIETIARRRLVEFPSIDDDTLAKMIRNEMRQQQVLNVDMYEATIYSVVRRLRTDEQQPQSLRVPPGS